MASTVAGDRPAADALFAALYSELHEAYLSLSRRGGPVFPDRARFMGYAAGVMRGLFVDHARSRSAEAGRRLPDHDAERGHRGHGRDRRRGGFSFREVAEMRDVSERTVQRQWEGAAVPPQQDRGSDRVRTRRC
jgi:hypothetical protein